VPHPFALLLANGWETTNPNRNPFIKSAAESEACLEPAEGNLLLNTLRLGWDTTRRAF
jgi:hypothetical protein